MSHFIVLGSISVSSLISKSSGEGDRDNLAYHAKVGPLIIDAEWVFWDFFSLFFGQQILSLIWERSLQSLKCR